MSTQPAPIVAPLVEGKPDTVVTSSVWRLFFQNLHVTLNKVTGAYVTSFNGRTGAVIPQTGDYSVGQVTGAIGDAPNDGKIYVRRNQEWQELEIG